MRPRARRGLERVALALAIGLGLASGCRSDHEGAPAPAETTAENDRTPALPPLELSDDSENLLLTWVDESGDFHVVENVGDVPPDRRERVRVVVTTETAGTGSTVYVANLSQKLPDGTYGVATMARSEWEKIGAEKRETRLEALSPKRRELEREREPPVAAGPVSAIVYGADWCKPCHDAERHLKSLGVQVTKKDIEQSRAARAEMEAKLKKINRSGASIPVIDVAGRLFVGFSPGALSQAVKLARGK